MIAPNSVEVAIRSRARRDMIEAGGRLCQLLGLPRSTGQIYGLLYLSIKPLSLDDLAELLSISKASASLGTRQLLSWGAIRQVWVPGERRDFFEAVPDLGNLIRAGYTDFLKPRLTSSRRRLDTMISVLDEELKHGIISTEEYDLCQERLKSLSKLQKKLHSLAPFAEKFM
jgi:HTH-type transcriptional regulator, glycine betaine synthesis regulator